MLIPSGEIFEDVVKRCAKGKPYIIVNANELPDGDFRFMEGRFFFSRWYGIGVDAYFESL